MALGYSCDASFGYSETENEVSLCCRNVNQCKFCQGNCQGNYSQVGTIAKIRDMGVW